MVGAVKTKLSQSDRVREVMSDGRWRTHREICAAIMYRWFRASSETGIAARGREIGLEKRRRQGNLWEYRMAVEGQGELF